MVGIYRKQRPLLFKTNPCSVFFTAWFRQISIGIDFPKLLGQAKPATVGNFIASLSLPVQFVYYLHQLFANMTISVLSGFLIDCFFRPMLVHSLDYGFPGRFSGPQQAEFIQALVEHKAYTEFVTGLIHAKPYYQMVPISPWDGDARIVWKFLSRRPVALDVLTCRDPPSLALLCSVEPSRVEMVAFRSWNWVAKAGPNTFLIQPHRIPPDSSFETLMYYFLLHFQSDDQRLELIVDARKITMSHIENFTSFVSAAPADMSSKVKTVTFVRLSFSSALCLQKMAPSEWTQKVRITEDVESCYGDSQIYLPSKYFREREPQHGLLSVTAYDVSCFFAVSSSGFVLRALAQIGGAAGHQCWTVSARKILRIDDDGTTVTIHTNHDQVKMTTNFGKLISTLWRSLTLRDSVSVHAEPRLAIESLSVTPRIYGISLSLYLLALDNAFLNVPAHELFEAAVANEPANEITCEIGFGLHSGVNLTSLFDEVIQAGLVDAVALCLSSFLTGDDVNTLSPLLPFFLTFMNTSMERCIISQVASRFISFSNNFGTQTVLERFFWSSIDSKVALELSNLPETHSIFV
jgi:hypothetical protein